MAPRASHPRFICNPFTKCVVSRLTPAQLRTAVQSSNALSSLTHPSRPNQQTRGPIHSILGGHRDGAPASTDISCRIP
jgi:hypothetical protein